MLFDFHKLLLNKLPILSVFQEASLIRTYSKVLNLSGLVVQYGSELVGIDWPELIFSCILQSNFIKLEGAQLQPVL